MKKIPTLFERDWAGDKSRVVDQIHAGCERVAAGEGVATRKLDGTSCLVRGGKLYKRREVRAGQVVLPPDFELSDYDEETGKSVGWVLVGDGPEDRWHREAFAVLAPLLDGTYELLGPKVQGNPEGLRGGHELVKHEWTQQYADAPRTFAALRARLLAACRLAEVLR